jgi:heme oxygenase
LRFRLRERTASLHAAVDEAVGAFKTLTDYRRYLAGLHGFRAPCEAALAAGPMPSGVGDWRFVPLVPMIALDMADLGVPIAARPHPLPPVASLEEAAGRLYVLEGSSLGARVLVAEARSLGLDERFGARHLVAQSRGGPDFRAFAGWLDEAPLNEEAVLAAALTTFAEAERAFTVPVRRGTSHAVA